MKPIITIIIPTYNRAHLIVKTLESVIAQSLTKWECIVVDDHSTDDTIRVVNMIDDDRIHVISNERNKGAQGARNTGLYQAKADWIFFFDSDNIMHPTLLEELTDSICNDIDVVSCFSRIIFVDKGDTGMVMESVNEGNIHDKLFDGSCYVDFNQAIIKKSKLFAIGGLDESCPSMQEWDTHIRLSSIVKYATIKKVLVDYYWGGGDTISADKKREVKGRLYILHKHIQEWHEHKNGLVKLGLEIARMANANSSMSFRLNTYFNLFKDAPILYYEFAKHYLEKLLS